METSSARKSISKLLHRVGDLSSRASTAGIVATAVVIVVVVLAANGFPTGWEATFGFAASAITLVMVFVIQHTQSRQQVATQLKLDRLIAPHRERTTCRSTSSQPTTRSASRCTRTRPTSTPPYAMTPRSPRSNETDPP